MFGWYQARYFGAEAASEDARDEAEENGWRLARFFKLNLHPAELRVSYNINTEGEYSTTHKYGWPCSNAHVS